MNSVASPPPEQGQLVDVRQRRWVVKNVAKNNLPAGPLQPFQKAQHLTTLSSVGDDTLGEELQIIWKLESGAKVIEKAAMPEMTGSDSPDKLDALRWVAASNADVKNIQMPPANLLNADGIAPRLTRNGG